MSLRVEPGVAEAVPSRGPLFGDHLQHGQQEVGEVAGILRGPAILLHQHIKQGPGLQLGDVPQLTFLGEKLSAVLPGGDHFAWNLPQKLRDQSDVI